MSDGVFSQSYYKGDQICGPHDIRGIAKSADEEMPDNKWMMFTLGLIL